MSSNLQRWPISLIFFECLSFYFNGFLYNWFQPMKSLMFLILKMFHLWLVLVNFSHDHSILLPRPCFLTQQGISGSSCTFSSLDLESTVYPRPWFLLFRDHNLNICFWQLRLFKIVFLHHCGKFIGTFLNFLSLHSIDFTTVILVLMP